MLRKAGRCAGCGGLHAGAWVGARIPFADHPLKFERYREDYAWPLRKDDTHKSRSVNRRAGRGSPREMATVPAARSAHRYVPDKESAHELAPPNGTRPRLVTSSEFGFQLRGFPEPVPSCPSGRGSPLINPRKDVRWEAAEDVPETPMARRNDGGCVFRR